MAELQDSGLFENLTGEELVRLQDVTDLENYQQGEVIFSEGDPGSGLYVVKSGRVEISAFLNGKDRKTLAHFQEGEFFGEMAVLDSEPRSATVTAVENTELYFIPRDQLLEMLEKSPRMVIGLMRLFSLRLRDFNRSYVREVLQAERLTVVGKFARSIVHDIKNPLNVIGLAAELLGTEKLSEEGRQNARMRIRKQVDRLSLMVNELLEFTRTGKTDVVLAEIDFQSFVQGIAKDMKAELEIKGSQIILENQPPITHILADPGRLHHVFHNLINNAVDAMLPEGGSVILRFKTDGQFLISEIEDTGPGIADEIAATLFEAFETFGKKNGTGLGLSICKKIIEDHNGSISTRRETGKGAIFAFTLPIPVRNRG